MSTSEHSWVSEQGKRLHALETGRDLSETTLLFTLADYDALIAALDDPPEPCDRLLRSVDRLNALLD